MIAYSYIDTQLATIAAIRDYKSIQATIDNTSKKIKEMYMNMMNIKAVQINDFPQKAI